MIQNKLMVSRIFIWANMALFISLFACSGIQVNRGPFPITQDNRLITGKMNYLENISGPGPSDSLPNIVVILVDDLGKYDISTYSSEGVPTPGIDRLAKNGITFTNAYSTSSVCSPSRASLLTGRYQQRFGFERQPMNRYPHGRLEYFIVDHFINTAPMRLVNPMSNPSDEELKMQGIPQEEILLPEVLSKRGYVNGIFGKWHLGYHEPFLPNRRGFEEQYGFYEAFTRYAPDDNKDIVNFRHDYFANRHIWRQKREGTCAIRENDMVINEKEYLTFSIADRACRFIGKNRGTPFFLYVPFSAPHTPFQVPLEYYNRFSHVEDENRRIYYGMISALDDAISRILDKIEITGLTGNTLIVFASDNGGATYTGATDNGVLKAGKFAQFEGGINIPMLISWKGILPAGTIYPYPVSLMDIFTTSLEIAGCDLPEDRTYDGIGLIPYLQNNGLVYPQRLFFWRTDFNKAVRQGDWKLVLNDRDDQVFLFNLVDDPGEEVNLASQNNAIVESMKEKLREWESELKEPMWPGVMEFKFDVDGEITWWAI